jgi:hypothetical protein
VRWKIEGFTVLLLSPHAEIRRGASRMDAERAILWIDEERSKESGKVVMDVYAEGNVSTVEKGVKTSGPRLFFRWAAPQFTVDDIDGFIETLKTPVEDDFTKRAEEVRKAAVPPAEIKPLAPREVPPKEVLPPGAAEAGRVGFIYGQLQEGPDIKSFVEGDYRITVLTRYPDIVIREPASTLEILAENMVIWVKEKREKGQGLSASELQVYAEGRVRIYSAGKTITCDRLFYDYGNQRGLILGTPENMASIKTFSRARNVPLFYRAKEFRQVSRDRYQADNAILTNSEFAWPEWGIKTERMELSSGRESVVDETGAVRDTVVREDLEAWNNFVTVRDVPVFYWPYFTRDLMNDRTVIRSLRFKGSNRFGLSVLTKWDLYDLGIYENDWSKLTLSVDEYSKRGLGLGLNFDYRLNDGWGEFYTYAIHDRGTDLTGLPPPDRDRERVKWRHRQFLSEHWRLDLEFSWISDSQFLYEYWEHEFKEEKEQESVGYLRYLNEDVYFSVTERLRTNTYQTQTEYNPEARLAWTGEPVGHGGLTYFQDTRVGNVLRRFDEEADRRDYRSWRFHTEHEVDYPVDVSIFRITPYFDASYTGYEITPEGGHSRLALTAGVRSSTQFWRIYNYYNRLLDINRLRHIITPSIDIQDTFLVTKRPDDIFQFDSVDDVEDVKVVNFRVRQRLQTRRPQRSVEPVKMGEFTPVGRETIGAWQTVDWMMLEATLPWFIDKGFDKNEGDKVGPLMLDYWWVISDRVKLLADARIGGDNGVQTFDIGLEINRSPTTVIYIGQRYTARSRSDISILSIDYKLDERWSLGYFGQYDFGSAADIRQRFTLRRRLHRWILELSFEYDPGKNDTSYGFMLMPQGLPEAKLRF